MPVTEATIAFDRGKGVCNRLSSRIVPCPDGCKSRLMNLGAIYYGGDECRQLFKHVEQHDSASRR